MEQFDTSCSIIRGVVMIRAIIVVPAFNEETTIGHVINKVRNATPDDSRYLILVVDDGSTDNTANVAQREGADIIIKHAENMGIPSCDSGESNEQPGLLADAYL